MMKTPRTKRLFSAVTACLLGLSCLAAGMPSGRTASAASVDYPVELVRISTADNARNLNITGMADKSPCNTWGTNGVQNENWRFDYVGTNSVGSYYKLTNMGSGRLLTPMGYATDEGTQCVIYGSESATSQHWYITPVAQDSYGNDLYYKITNYDNANMAVTYNAADNTVTLNSYTGADNQKWLLNAAGLQGFAGYAKDTSGSPKASAIGGLLGETVEVDTFDELKAACSDDTPRTIVITGDISKTGTYTTDSNGRYRFNDAGIYLYPNKTIIGSYGANSLYNVYFRTYEGGYGQGRNIIIRNIEISHDKELNNDNIWEFSYGWNFWIDHCTFVGHSAINTASTGQVDWDKFLNFKGTTDFVTISDCKFGLHEYGVLLGYPTDTQETYDTYNGKPCVTLADNYYKDCITRAPGLMRYGYFHSMNNFVENFDMGYTIYTACKLYSENNYFVAGTGKGSIVNDGTSTSDISHKYPGVYTDSGSVNEANPSWNFTLTAKNAAACSWRPSSNYSYTAMTAAEAKAHCTAYSGSQTSRSNYTYAMFAEAGMPSAGYVEAPTVGMLDNITIDGGRLLTEVQILDYSTYADWRVDTDIQIGDMVFGDRDVTYTSIPAGLIGGEALVTACDAKNTTTDLAVCTAGEAIDVYVALDHRVTTLPAWLQGWEATGGTVTNSKDVVFDLYRTTLSKGDVLTLGANGQSSGCVNYTVFAVEAGTPVLLSLLAGDVTMDGKVNGFDLALQKRGTLQGFGSESAARCGDVNADGSNTVQDIVQLTQFLLGMDVTLYLPEVQAPTTEPPTEADVYEPAGFAFSGEVYLVGDSTVCTYDANTVSTLNRMGWGMQLANAYNGVTVQNLALSGRSSRSFLTENNYTTLCSSIGAGDYLFIQFGHNDEKTDEATYPGLGTYPGLDMNTLDSNGMNSSGQYSYEWILLHKYIQMAQSKGAVPVLVTPITRRGGDGTANYGAHTAYQQALLTLGETYDIAVIDMTALTTELYTNLYNSGGASATAALHCYSDTNGTIDNTHLSVYGAQTIAGMIAEQTKELGLQIGDRLK